MSDLARQSIQRSLIPEETVLNIRAAGARLQHGLILEETVSNIRSVQERLAELAKPIADVQVRFSAQAAALAEVFKPIGLMSNVVQFPTTLGFQFHGAPSAAPAIIRPDTEDVINVERGMPIRNKGGRPSHHGHHHERITFLLAHGHKPWAVAGMIIDDAIERVRTGKVPKGVHATTNDPEQARMYGLVCSGAVDVQDSLSKYIKRIAPELLGFGNGIALKK